MLFFQNIGSPVVQVSKDAEQIQAIEAQIRSDKSRISSDRNERTIQRLNAKGRMTAQERVYALCDDGDVWLLDEYQGFDSSEENQHKPYRLGVICALGRVCGRQAIILANDNTVTAGAWWPGTPEKIVHALDMALLLQIPVFYLIECAGLYLPKQDQTFAGPEGAGAIFQKQAQLNRCGILQVAAILGDCIAGGGYMPLLCDKIVMTEQASLCIGGTAIHAHTKGNSDERLGSASVHVHQSGCADVAVLNDEYAIQKLRFWASQMPDSACDFYRVDEPIDPQFDIDDLYHLLPRDLSKSYDIEQILARLVDGSQLQPLYDAFGHEIFGALTLIDGLPCVVIANRATPTRNALDAVQAGGILYRDGITKMRKICESANDDGVPVIWFQDVSGFDIGPEAESQGLLRHGAMLLHELAQDSLQTPAHMAVILRKASGAGYYAMKGAPFHPAIIVATAFADIEVMDAQTLAGTLYDRKIQSLPEGDSRRLELEEQKQEAIRSQKQSATPQKAAMRGDIDDVVELNQLRQVLISFVQAAWQNAARPSKPLRLWSLLNDLS